ncbi:MAG: beta-N-acetylhexosaminidase [Halioglobus sp.]
MVLDPPNTEIIPKPMSHAQNLTLEQCIGLKMMLDIRFFDSGDGAGPVLRLPPQLAQGLAEIGPCGVIVFRENLESVAQCQQLTADIRGCLTANALIGIDQEGGRVTRLPRKETTSFSGNMALAACPSPENEKLARGVGETQARELKALGINLNFVPSLDVNSDPHNPVIGVRSFGDDPSVVARLGRELLGGLQNSGVAGALKHFPGHGDTSQDSHTDLPCVARSRDDAYAIDLAPFVRVIAEAAPAMVMTAHIQYPALDASYISGTDVVVPATLSRVMMTDLLREELGFAGVIISDALDMKAISARMTPAEAVKHCFAAGVDIALMPLLVRSKESLDQLLELVRIVAEAVRRGEIDEAEVRASADRILAVQQQYALGHKDPVAKGDEVIACSQHLALEKRIAQASVTLLSGTLKPLGASAKVHLLMPGKDTAAAMCAALLSVEPSLVISWQSLESFDATREQALLEKADVYLVGVSEPASSAVALGGAEDLPNLPDASPASVQKALLRQATALQRIVLMLNSPYRAPEYEALTEAALASYDGAAVGVAGAPGPAYLALAKVLCGQLKIEGKLPVELDASRT